MEIGLMDRVNDDSVFILKQLVMVKKREGKNFFNLLKRNWKGIV